MAMRTTPTTSQRVRLQPVWVCSSRNVATRPPLPLPLLEHLLQRASPASPALKPQAPFLSDTFRSEAARRPVSRPRGHRFPRAAGLALLAATTGFCTGCEAYKLGSTLLGRPFVACPLPPQPAARPD